MSFFRRIVACGILALPLGGCAVESEPAWSSRDARVLGLDSEMAEDPVTGQRVSKQGAIKREYRGSIYYFESGETAAVFDRNPPMYAVVENVPPNEPAGVK